MANAFRTSYVWSRMINVDDTLAYSYITDLKNKGCYFGIPDLDTFDHMSTSDLIFNEKFPILTKTFSDYVGLHKTKVLSINKWTPEYDDAARQLLENISDSPLPFQYLTTDVHIDYDLRTYSRIIDYTKRPENAWCQEDNIWGFFGPFYSEALEDGYFTYCMISKNQGHWINNYAKLTDGGTVTFNKTADIAYLIVRGDGIKINGTSLADGEIRKIKSQTLSISKTGPDMSHVCIRELQTD